jgi:hypothetical protein
MSGNLILPAGTAKTLFYEMGLKVPQLPRFVSQSAGWTLGQTVSVASYFSRILCGIASRLLSLCAKAGN